MSVVLARRVWKFFALRILLLRTRSGEEVSLYLTFPSLCPGIIVLLILSYEQLSILPQIFWSQDLFCLRKLIQRMHII